MLVISGPSGVGKTTITRAVERAVDKAVFSVSATTRTKTRADTDGVDYHFLTDDEFDARVHGGDFLEHAEYAGHRYGTLRQPIEEALHEGLLVILDIDIQGAIQVKDAMPEAYAVFVLPPSEQALLDRLHERRRETEKQIQRRFEIAKREIAQAHTCGAYDAFVVNDELSRAIQETIELVHHRRAMA